jgi:sodium pump decarboxylase gamma subunit
MFTILLAEEASNGVRIQFDALFTDTGIPLAIMGMLVVFAALILVTVYVTLLPRLAAYLENRFPEKATPQPIAQPINVGDDLSEEVLVVIAAAVAEVIDEPHRIIHTRQLTPLDLAWSFEGRRQQHISHRPRNR